MGATQDALQIGDGLRLRFTTLQASGAIPDRISIIRADATAGDLTLTLPLAASVPGQIFLIKKIDATSHQVIISGSGSETVDGAVSQFLTSQYAGVFVLSDGITWWLNSPIGVGVLEYLLINQPGYTTGTPTPAVRVNAGAHSFVLNAEQNDINLNLARTVTFVGGGGAIATERAMLIQAPTYSSSLAQTITSAATLSITGAPSVAGGMTITNPIALWVQTGNVQFGAVGSGMFWDYTNQALRVPNAQFTGSPWFDVKAYGAVGNAIADDTTAIQNAINAVPVGGGVVFIPKGNYLITGSGLSSTNRHLVIQGAGKGVSILTYTGSGSALTLGDNSGGNVDGLRLSNFSIFGSASGVTALVTKTFNGFSIDNITLSGFSTGIGWDTNGSNSGSASYCDFYNNGIGIAFTSNGLFVANCITVFGGQILSNTTAIQSLVNTTSNKLIGVNVASTITSPAFDIRQGTGWIVKGCFFENNAGGAGSSCIRIGTATVTDISQAHTIEGNYFVENNSLAYGVDVVRGGYNTASFNQIACTFTTAFYRAETNASKGIIWGNSTPGNSTPILSDVSTSTDQFDMGVGTRFLKSATGYTFSTSLNIGTATDASAQGDFAVGLTAAARMVFSQAAPTFTLYNSAGTAWWTASTTSVTYDLIGGGTGRVVLTANNNVGSIALKNAGTTIFQILDAGDVWLNTTANENMLFRTNNTSRFSVTSGGCLITSAALATNMTTGFINIPAAAGAPSGTPVSTTGVSLYYDTTNNFLYVYTGGAWKKSTVYA